MVPSQLLNQLPAQSDLEKALGYYKGMIAPRDFNDLEDSGFFANPYQGLAVEGFGGRDLLLFERSGEGERSVSVVF